MNAAPGMICGQASAPVVARLRALSVCHSLPMPDNPSGGGLDLDGTGFGYLEGVARVTIVRHLGRRGNVGRAVIDLFVEHVAR